MSAEERWAQRKEWEQERGEIEIKWVSPDYGDSAVLCDKRGCWLPSRKTIEVGLVKNKTGERFDLCAEHANATVAIHLFYQRGHA